MNKSNRKQKIWRQMKIQQSKIFGTQQKQFYEESLQQYRPTSRNEKSLKSNLIPKGNKKGRINIVPRWLKDRKREREDEREEGEEGREGEKERGRMDYSGNKDQKNIEKINETKTWVFVKINKIDKSCQIYARCIKKIRERTEIDKTRNERREIITKTTKK